LEKRISRLEQAIGGTAGLDAASKVPLAEAVEEMQLRLQLLNPTHIDGLHARATKLLAKMQQNEKEDSEFEEKVEKLYDMMNRWDAACIGLPSAVRRMYDLRKLHEQAEQFSKKLSLLMGIREQLSKTMKNKELAMLEFREQIHGALEKLTSDMEKLEERIKKLAP
uniref:Dynactin subunit 2 n=1 Tax=Gongylonema pulchrum TaxID=637853 RepID=A0A183CUZ7_9BILA